MRQSAHTDIASIHYQPQVTVSARMKRRHLSHPYPPAFTHAPRQDGSRQLAATMNMIYLRSIMARQSKPPFLPNNDDCKPEDIPDHA
jgi:hypothetical protein